MSEVLHDGQHNLWSDLREREGSVQDEHLSQNKLAVKNVKLSFEFPYYGHMVTDATLTTGGKTKLHILLILIDCYFKFIILISKKKNVLFSTLFPI